MSGKTYYEQRDDIIEELEAKVKKLEGENEKLKKINKSLLNDLANTWYFKDKNK